MNAVAELTNTHAKIVIPLTHTLAIEGQKSAHGGVAFEHLTQSALSPSHQLATAANEFNNWSESGGDTRITAAQSKWIMI